MGAGVGTAVETEAQGVGSSEHRLSIRMLGRLAVARGDVELPLPPSRKARALFAYLVLSPGAVSRSRLCDLLWDGPNDPRGELRWCLSRLRAAFAEDEVRIETADDAVRLTCDDASVDVFELSAAASAGFETLPTEALESLAGLFRGEFLEGLQIERSPTFANWLTAHRRRLQALELAVLDALVGRLATQHGRAAVHLEKWLELSPFDLRAHRALLSNLLARGMVQACEQHIEAAVPLFQSEDVDVSPLRDLWQQIRRRIPASPHQAPPPAAPDAAIGPVEPSGRQRASLAVMPFVPDPTQPSIRGGLADGLTHDIITRLAKLRDFFVIARGSVYALAERGLSAEEAGRRLNVDYVASGTVREEGGRIAVGVELIEVRTARIVWTERLEPGAQDIFAALDDIGDSIVSSIAAEIETAERNRALLKAPNSLNAWEAYHRGLWHMYRFTSSENEIAQGFFRKAVEIDPTFARAHSGLSFTHWQNAFQKWGDRDREAGLALDAAGRSLIVDDHNPAAHWAMGRALWLHGRSDESLTELEHAVGLSPNFALGHYALAFVHSQSGSPQAAIGSSDQSRHLSPFDPLLFGMLGARAMAHVRLGQFEEAADWALRALARPNAHIIIQAIAANCLALAGRIEEGRILAMRIRQIRPHYDADEFLASFRFEPDAAARYRHAARLIGLD